MPGKKVLTFLFKLRNVITENVKNIHSNFLLFSSKIVLFTQFSLIFQSMQSVKLLNTWQDMYLNKISVLCISCCIACLFCIPGSLCLMNSQRNRQIIRLGHEEMGNKAKVFSLHTTSAFWSIMVSMITGFWSISLFNVSAHWHMKSLLSPLCFPWMDIQRYENIIKYLNFVGSDYS